MHVQIINFRLEGIDEEAYRKQAEAIAPAFAEMSGLVSKTWLANREANTYGGMYVWRDREAMERYAASEIFRGMAANSHFVDVSVKDFAVLEAPTRVTRGNAEVAV